ncbi:hypothetical protein ABPG75_001586 [Micractinium tetrahymenae]
MARNRRNKRFLHASQQELEEAKAAHARDVQLQPRAAGEKAAAAVARAAALQRHRSGQRVRQWLGDDEGLPGFDDMGADLDETSADSSARPSEPANSTRSRQPGGVASHQDRQQEFEKGMRLQTASMVQWGTLHAAERAAALRQDLEQRLATVQGRVHAAVASACAAGHVGCSCVPTAATASCVKVVGWRPVILQTLFGQGAIDIATLK